MSETIDVDTAVAGNTSGMGKLYALPDGVAGWSWGAFAFSWIWAIGNSTWLGLLAFIPGIGLIVRVMLGIKGREWAWQNKRWDSVDHFNRVQRRWSIWALVLVGLPLLGIVAAVALPAYQDYLVKRPLAEALVYADNASAVVGRYIESHKALPHGLDDIGLPAPQPSGTAAVALDPGSGQLKFTLDVGQLSGRAFYLAPTVEADGKIAWRCLRGDIPRHLLPARCQFDTADPFTP